MTALFQPTIPIFLSLYSVYWNSRDVRYFKRCNFVQSTLTCLQKDRWPSTVWRKTILLLHVVEWSTRFLRH